MTVFSSLLFLSWIFAFISEKANKTSVGISLYFTLLVGLILSLISGIRTKYNDTELYIYNFIHSIPTNFTDLLTNIDIAIGSNPGFYFYQFFIKSYISDNPYVFIFLTSLIINTLFITFYKKYSTAFGLTIFFYITSGLFMLGMAAVKQLIAMSIGLWAIHFFIKNKYKTFIVILIFASMFHPFILLYLVAYFLYEQVWTRKIIWTLIGTLVIGVFFVQFVELLLSWAGTIGINYDSSFILEKAGVNPLRLAIFAMPSILSYIYREQINDTHNKILIVSVNFSIISFLFMIVASYGGANMFGRLASYFEPFTYLSLSWILYKAIPKNYNIAMIVAYIIAYSFYFYYQFYIKKHFEYNHILENII